MIMAGEIQTPLTDPVSEDNAQDSTSNGKPKSVETTPVKKGPARKAKVASPQIQRKPTRRGVRRKTVVNKSEESVSPKTLETVECNKEGVGKDKSEDSGNGEQDSVSVGATSGEPLPDSEMECSVNDENSGNASADSNSDCIVMDSMEDVEVLDNADVAVVDSEEIDPSVPVEECAEEPKPEDAKPLEQEPVEKIGNGDDGDQTLSQKEEDAKPKEKSEAKNKEKEEKEPADKKEKPNKEKSSQQLSSKSPSNDPVKNGSKTAPKSAEKKESSGKDVSGKDKVKRLAPSDKSVWVSSLSNKTRAADLKALFSKHGKVATAKILTNSKTPGARCYGLVTMITAKDALACIKHLHHTELHGRVISVERTRKTMKKLSPSRSSRSSNSHDKTEKKPETVTEGAEKKEKEKTSGEEAKKTPVKSENESKSRSPKRRATSTSSKSRHSPKKNVEESKETEASKDSSGKEKKSSKSPERENNRRSRPNRSRERGSFSRDRSNSRGRVPFQSRFRRNEPMRSQWRPPRRSRSRSPIRRVNGNYMDRYGNPIRPGFERSGPFSRDRFDDQDMKRENRRETMRLERERDRLRQEREELEREKARVLQMEKEQQRVERAKLEHEMEELRRFSMSLNMPSSQMSKRSADSSGVWDERKRGGRLHGRDSGASTDRERRDGRRDTNVQSHVSSYYDAAGRRPPYHGGHGTSSSSNHPPTWNHPTPEPNKYGASSAAGVVPGVWASMDVPPPPIPQQQRWGNLDQNRAQHLGSMTHQAPPVPPPNQVVMFVGNNPADGGTGTGNMQGQYMNNRFNTNIRRF